MKILSFRFVYPLPAILLFACGLIPHSSTPTAATNIVQSPTVAWDNPGSLSENISPDDSQALNPDVAMDNNNNTIITWSQEVNGIYKIFKSEYRNGVWTNPANLDDHLSQDESTVILLTKSPLQTNALGKIIRTQDALLPQVAMDDNGNAIITWYQWDGTFNRIFKSEYRNGAWSVPNSVSENISVDGSSAPQVAMSNNGDAIIAWYQADGTNFRIFKSEYRNGVWSNPTSASDSISFHAGVIQSTPAQVAMDNNGNAIITWYQYDGIQGQVFRSEYRNGAWISPVSLTDNVTVNTANVDYPQVAMSDNGDAIVTWLQFDGVKFQIFKSEYRGGVWASPSGLSADISRDNGSAGYPQVAMDSSGNTVIVWYQSTGINDQIFKSEYRGGAWTNPATLADNVSPDGQNARIPQVAMDDNGNAIITWAQSDGSNEQIFKSTYRQGIWSNPTGLSDNISPDGQYATTPEVAMDNNDNAVIVWSEADGSVSQIFKSEYR